MTRRRQAEISANGRHTGWRAGWSHSGARGMVNMRRLVSGCAGNGRHAAVGRWVRRKWSTHATWSAAHRPRVDHSASRADPSRPGSQLILGACRPSLATYRPLVRVSATPVGVSALAARRVSAKGRHASRSLMVMPGDPLAIGPWRPSPVRVSTAAVGVSTFPSHVSTPRRAQGPRRVDTPEPSAVVTADARL